MSAFITLHYREGSSDKIYQASLVDVGGLFEVQFAYGRRGNAALTTGKKTMQPVPKAEAMRIWDRLIGDKIKKGYREMGESIGSHTVAVPETTGILPQLLNAVDEEYHTFDLLEHDGSYRAQPLRRRLVALFNLVASRQAPSISLVASYTQEAVKRRFLGRSREDNLEGVVFKDMTAPYIPGRPYSGGAQRKFKFVQTASVVVTNVNGKRSVKIGVLDGERMISCGNVTIPVGSDIPGIGDIVEVRYLYAFPESGSLFQPVYLGVRDDIELKDCTRDQLQFKREPELQAA